MYFKDRIQAGELLANKLSKYGHRGAIVYALPRGGIIPASIIARTLPTLLRLMIKDHGKDRHQHYSPKYLFVPISLALY